MTARENITAEFVAQYLRYCPTTGNFYHARPRPRIRCGAVAGTPGKNGYIYISIMGVSYLAHRMAWFVTHGEWPKVVDHANGDPMDNRICNLRPANQTLNLANARRRSDNTSGFKGVSFFKRDGTYMAQIRRHGVYEFLGYFKTPEEAHQAYNTAAKRLFGEFARAA